MAKSMPVKDLPGSVDLEWKKSERSGPQGDNCVEATQLPGGDVAIRHSQEPDGTALVYSEAEIAAFFGGVKDGEFDYLLPS